MVVPGDFFRIADQPLILGGGRVAERARSLAGRHHNLFTHVDVIAADLSISVALFQIQFVLPRIERPEVRTCLD